MTKQSLLNLLELIPDNADIRIVVGDDILGDWSYFDFGIREEEARLAQT